MKEYLEAILERRDLGEAESCAAFDRIMTGEATPAQIAGLLIGLRMKGESVAEIAGGAASMRRHAVRIDTGGLPVVDTCGTGGDGSGSFNISTAAALVTAGAGVPVAKHGNRAISSACGSADVLAELGVNLDIPPEKVEDCVREAGIGFLFAPKLHPAMKHAMGPRRELGVRTIFNMLGPLTNPAGAKGQIIGVFSPELTEPFAEVLLRLGSRRAFVVHGHDGMDEITVTAATRVSELQDGKVKTYELDPLRFIEDYADAAALRGGDASVNAGIIRKILAGDKSPARDVVCLNAAAAIVAGGRADTLDAGWKAACASIDSGGAADALARLIACTNE